MRSSKLQNDVCQHLNHIFNTLTVEISFLFVMKNVHRVVTCLFIKLPAINILFTHFVFMCHEDELDGEITMQQSKIHPELNEPTFREKKRTIMMLSNFCESCFFFRCYCRCLVRHFSADDGVVKNCVWFFFGR